MSESALGTWLKGLRDARELSLRDVAQRSGIDHAYIYRLENGLKEAPSNEIIQKLISALMPSARETDILQFLVDHRNVGVGLVEFVQSDPSVTAAELDMLTTVVNRGVGADYATSLARIRRFMEEDDDDD